MPMPRPLTRLLPALLYAAVAFPLVALPAAVVALANGLPLPASVHGTIGSGNASIGFSGEMLITTRIIDDPDFRSPPVLELIIDFSSVRGVAAPNGRKFVSGAQAIIRRPLLAFDQIEVTFPYAPADDLMSARTAKASLGVSLSARSGVGITSTISSL